MRRFRLEIPPHVAEVIRHLPPDLKRSVGHALRVLAEDPECGVPLLGELRGQRKYRVRRYRIVYAAERKRRVIRVFAVGHRREIYDDLSESVRKRR